MTQEKVIVLKAMHGKQQGYLDLTPARDRVTGRLRGVKPLSQEDMRLAIRAVDGNTVRKITDGLTLNLNDETDRIDWEWIKECREISLDRYSALGDPNVLFYVDQPDREVDERISKFDTVLEAGIIVKDASQVRKAEICRYLGFHTAGLPPKDILDYLADIAQKKPEKIIKANEDPQFKQKIFLFSLIDANIVKKDKNGIYRYGDIVLGLNVDAALVWLNDKANRDLVGRFFTKLKESGSPISTSAVDDFEQLDKSNKDNAGSGQAGEAAIEVVNNEL